MITTVPVRSLSSSIIGENKAYTLGLSQLLVFIAVAMNNDGSLVTNVYALFSL